MKMETFENLNRFSFFFFFFFLQNCRQRHYFCQVSWHGFIFYILPALQRRAGFHIDINFNILFVLCEKRYVQLVYVRTET